LAVKDLALRIKNGIETYNRYRSPEVTAKLLIIKGKDEEFTISFSGTFCRTCGFYDYFEDLIYELFDESKIQVRILGIQEDWKSESFNVVYKIEK
jgi:hypothetical protein